MLTDEQREHWAYQVETARLYVQNNITDPPGVLIEPRTLLAVDARLAALSRVAECARRWRMSAPSEVRAALDALDAPEPRP